MGIRQFKPVTKGTRFRSVSDFAEITRTTPEKSLLEPLKKSGGRDNHGHISMRRRGGGHKRMYRIIDFRRNKFGVPATVREIEYDPNRSARIALVEYADGEKRYVLHPQGLAVGRHDRLRAGLGHADWATRCRCKESRWAPTCTTSSSRSARAARWRARPAAGVEVVAKEGEYVTLRLRVDGDAAGARELPGDDRRRSATPSTSCSRGARRARRAGWAGGPRCAAK